MTLTSSPMEWKVKSCGVDRRKNRTKKGSEILHRGNYVGDFYYKREQRDAVVTDRGFVVKGGK